ncbi:adenylate/guanylate cyclase domain-containing protein [Bradyrhizobium sp. NP1]|uniref:adenylate/guanylate cyclase domain-containing protein n=1 Tax=Bradyrhizobium sp. NP1 TaxID=3049772 RepID=UPI0025A52F7D|nr:adenylate/guanylate cyclase domain-containing protein [Bradyrhizobium sp. NP1]WJR77160.1 adenylate/guanylate cyclase domain-containing protein [Bradyrhizobium sp. NP1]
MHWIIRPSIRRKIVGIAVGLIVLMVLTSLVSVYMASTVGHLLDELNGKYFPAYNHLAQANIRSLERAIALRRMMIMKMQAPPDEEGYAARLKNYQEADAEVEQEAQAARKLINSIIDDVTTPSDNAALARIDDRIENAIEDTRKQLGEEAARLLRLLDAKNFAEARQSMEHVDALRDDFTLKIDAIRADMLKQVYASSAVVTRNQRQAMMISTLVTALAAAIGLGFALIVSSGITRPVRQLLEGAREIEAGRLDRSVSVSTADEIGQLTAAFNRMVDRLRRNEQVRATFGRYFDPKVIEGMIDEPAQAASMGQRRVMTVLFCDMKGFTAMSEDVTPQGLVKIINHYLSTMSSPIRNHKGILDKYIGDAIMAYWGPPFVVEDEQADLACLAAIDMIDSVATLRKELPELLDVRSIPMDCDIRLGIATGEVLAGSIGSEFMMSFTVMGDAVNLASRLEAANKEYGTRSLVSEATVAALDAAIELREIDRLVVLGQSRPQAVFEILGKQGALAPRLMTLRDRYAEGLAAYRDRRWADARKALRAALEAVDDDGPSLTLLKRIDAFEASPPAPGWDGAWYMDHK